MDLIGTVFVSGNIIQLKIFVFLLKALELAESLVLNENNEGHLLLKNLVLELGLLHVARERNDQPDDEELHVEINCH